MQGKPTIEEKAFKLIERQRSLKNYWVTFNAKESDVTFSSDVEYYSKNMGPELRNSALDLRDTDNSEQIVEWIKEALIAGWEY